MDAPKKMSKTTIWLIVAVIVIIAVVVLYFTVFKKNEKPAARTTEEPGAQPCDAKAPIPAKGKAKNETGGYCIPVGIDLFGLNPITDKKDIMGWMGFAVENNWKVDNMGHLANVAAYQLTQQRSKAK